MDCKRKGDEYQCHYLHVHVHDFIMCGPAGSDEFLFKLTLLKDIRKHLGVPLAEEKIEGPQIR